MKLFVVSLINKLQTHENKKNTHYSASVARTKQQEMHINLSSKC